MKFFKWGKDGGPDSKVEGLFIVEIKKLFSIVLLKFTFGSREAYHSHAFNAVSWVLTGGFEESRVWKTNINSDGDVYPSSVRKKYFSPSFKPKFTSRDNCHKVFSYADSTWVLSFRGPWRDWWYELKNGRLIKLTHGRKEI